MHEPKLRRRESPRPRGRHKAKCPKCGSEWRIFWIKAGFPRVKGPVWETSQKLANEALAKMAAAGCKGCTGCKAREEGGKVIWL